MFENVYLFGFENLYLLLLSENGLNFFLRMNEKLIFLIKDNKFYKIVFLFFERKNNVS